ncbi:MAG: hypothetical protein IKR34_03010 [Candidatus Gastranaerophilales bacterium]|nr:hypothetical protein [Candidatus Gastranaerophilales bacterium]
MNPERLQLKGMLAESKKQLGELRTQASGYVLIIRSLLNPYEDVSKLDTEKALSSMKLLNNAKNEIVEVSKKIKDLEAELE